MQPSFFNLDFEGGTGNRIKIWYGGTHSEFPIDEPVWLTPGYVVNGKDTVVNAAVRWINQQF